MPEEGVALRSKNEFMTSEEVIQIASAFVSLGIKKIRLTGGEPLIKKDFNNILHQLSRLGVEISITTNGILLHKHFDSILEAGVTKINISLDTLKRQKFNLITRRDYFDLVYENIQNSLLIFDEVKLNVVLIKGKNDNELIDFIDFTKENKVNIRFIEYMPFDGNNWRKELTVTQSEINNILQLNYGNKIVKLLDDNHSTSRNFKIEKHLGTFGFINTITNPFCDSCNRIRLTADGKLKNCLFSSNEMNLLYPLRSGKDIIPLIFKNINEKFRNHGGINSFEKDSHIYNKNRTMIAIGG
tara:strand:+ start:3400 stop:4296 length:897 start_codon:yes stop_codon:yes gene_type:complete